MKYALTGKCRGSNRSFIFSKEEMRSTITSYTGTAAIHVTYGSLKSHFSKKCILLSVQKEYNFLWESLYEAERDANILTGVHNNLTRRVLFLWKVFVITYMLYNCSLIASLYTCAFIRNRRVWVSGVMWELSRWKITPFVKRIFIRRTRRKQQQWDRPIHKYVYTLLSVDITLQCNNPFILGV